VLGHLSSSALFPGIRTRSARDEAGGPDAVGSSGDTGEPTMRRDRPRGLPRPRTRRPIPCSG
jgi:hypothetical protein